MDLGPASRELAPLKLKRPKNLKHQSQVILKVKMPKAPTNQRTQDPASVEDEREDHLFNNHMFHHMIGLSNLKKTLRNRAEEFNIRDMSPDRPEDDSFYMRETSYDHDLNNKSPISGGKSSKYNQKKYDKNEKKNIVLE